MMTALALATSLVYEGTRLCSDGRTPRDLIGTRPVHFEFDENSRLEIFTESEGPKGGVCLTTQKGTYRFDLKTLTAVIETVETCGDCQPRAPAEGSESSATVTTLPGVLRLRFDGPYDTGGSCARGQSIVLDLRLTSARSKPRCDSTPTS